MTVASLAEENARLQALLAETQAALAESEEARRRLESIVTELRREKFEKLSPEQYNLPLEDVELAQGMLDAAHEKAERLLEGESQGKRPRNGDRGRLPPHLPRVERVIEPASTLCPCGCGEMAKIGEDVSARSSGHWSPGIPDTPAAAPAPSCRRMRPSTSCRAASRPKR